MQTKSKEKINIVTLGCAKNIVDSEVLLTQLKGNNKDAYHQSEDISPDVVIVNTCGFIDNAKQQSVDTILSYAKEMSSNNSAVDKSMKLDILTTLNDSYLQKSDLSTMAYSLECRSPLLSKKIIEWSQTLETSQKVNFFNKKII